MARRLALVVIAAAGLSACSAKLPADINEAALTQAIGKSIGSPSTCVIVADAQGRTVWRGGGYITCSRNLPTCQGGETTTAAEVLKAGLGKPARFTSCPTTGANTVGWAVGPVPTGEGKPQRDLTYVAVMEGERALPGLEIKERAERAFEKAGF
ncbi:hypothetical protein B7G68_15085 [Caulobacter segnis]|uniref:Lipoprotein n=2 Tax=Caulobacter segnis TaxID=88688 RepID=D5VLL6_CAUST|nr:hypothetical protein [Caulobacter segnis]ADG11389.1 conserved hypothetical protein [Caulobacter segnis ATCC 21756]AVQ03057.1 hypothetical protein B7G68_15085 [Caulobacter segnis]